MKCMMKIIYYQLLPYVLSMVLLFFCCFFVILPVYANEEETAGATQHNMIGSFADIDASPKLQQQYEEVTGQSYNGDSFLNIVKNYVAYWGCNAAALKNGDFSQLFSNGNAWEDYKNGVYAYDDGYYGFDEDIQQAVYDALLQYTAEVNGGYYFKPVQASSPVSPGSGYTWGYYYSRYGWNYVLTGSPEWWYYQPAGSTYPAQVVAFNGNNQVIGNQTPYGYYNSSGTFYSQSSSFIMFASIYNYSTSWGPAVIAYTSYDAYKGSVSADSDAYINTGWSPSGMQYISPSGLAYDWSSQNALNYERLQQAVGNGTISGQTAINEMLSDMAEELEDIKSSLDNIEDDTGDILSVLKDIRKYAKSIRNWMVADTMVDIADSIWNFLSDYLTWSVALNSVADEFSPLVEASKTRFPFSVPWDIYNIFCVFTCEPETPHFDMPLLFKYGDYSYTYNFDIDFGKFDTLAALLRSALVVKFLISIYKWTYKIIEKDGDD